MSAEYKAPKADLGPMHLRYVGLFDFDGLYAATVDWAKNEGYIWYESAYKHKIPSPKGAEQELLWFMEKKVTEYIHFKIQIDIHSWDQREVEVDVNGKKKNLTQARFHLKMTGILTGDWQKRFAKGGFLGQKLGKWYGEMVYKKEFYNYYDQLYYRMWNLHAILKKYLDMQTQKHVYKGYLGENWIME